ncbi:MAG: SIMPL domain-containing protein [Gammaproteobacteria bacterium]|nr:SIMPL domain-containing protein [Gammaproteobacteria bacterium]
MRNVIRAASTVLALFLANAALAQTFTTKPFLSVQGHAEAKVKPDIFPVKVKLEEVGMNPAKSQVLVEDLAAKVLASAKAQGADDRNIDIGNLSISPETKWDDKTEKDVFLGNSYERQIEVRFKDLESARQFIASLPDMRQVRITTGVFQYSGRRELERNLRREAIADASAAAKDMAHAVDKRLLELFNVSDRAQSTIYSNIGYDGYSGGPVPRDITSTALLAPGTVRDANIVLKEGEITISADAFLVYIIGD